MKSVISIGNQDFRSIREHKCFYVDKTNFIKEWWESQDIVTLITRPRRFGKTLNVNMIETFFSNQYTGRSDLFEGLSIWEDKTYQKLQGTYPVISFSFADIKATTFESARAGIIQKLIRLCNHHLFVRDYNKLNHRERLYFDSLHTAIQDTEAAVAINYLSEYLNRYYNKKVIVLLDEYDTPLQEAYIYGYWEEMVGFTRSLFNSSFKTNPYLERGLMTGITRVSKESIFSDLNNLAVVTTTSEQYATSFGFTEKEVFHALEQQGLPKQKEKVKEWYDGFTFGSQTDIYNPWSITNFLKENKLKTYWANTSSNSLVSKLIRESSSEIKITMEDLMAGKQIITPLDEEIAFNQLSKKRGAIWSLLLASGYLKVTKTVFDAQTDREFYYLEITNYETYILFKTMIEEWFSAEETHYNDFIKALLMDDIDYMNKYMNQVALQTFSNFDTGRQASQLEPERFYHGFVLGLMVELSDRYRITSNRESGFGRYDVLLEPIKDSLDAIIIEFKVHHSTKEKNLQDTVNAALAQIEEKNYDTELLVKGIPKERIRHYGFAFEGKKVFIGKQ